MLCAVCENEPCTCQKQLAVANSWINQECSSPGCTVIIRSRVGYQPSMPVCKWCEQDIARYRKAESKQKPHAGPLMTRDEFGMDLHEAIKLQAGIETARVTACVMREKGLESEAIEKEQWIAAAEKKLGELLDAGNIHPVDVRRILGIQSRKLELVP